MHRESYFSEAKRSSISDKFAEACVDGELLCQFGMDFDKLVQFMGLPFGDAVKLAEEVSIGTRHRIGPISVTICPSRVVVGKERLRRTS